MPQYGKQVTIYRNNCIYAAGVMINPPNNLKRKMSINNFNVRLSLELVYVFQKTFLTKETAYPDN